MKTGIISSSTMFASGRFDAEFHLLNSEYAGRADAISVSTSKEDIVEFLSDENQVPLAVLKLITPLTRGRSEIVTRDKLLKAVVEYPFLSMAVIQDKGSDLIQEAISNLKHNTKSLESAQATLNEKYLPIPNLADIPSEMRGDLAKSNFVAGVVYFDGDTLAIPVETSDTAYVADCWVVELADWAGAITIEELVADGNVPVPRRQEDLGKPVGFVEHLADHKKNYDVGWRFRP